MKLLITGGTGTFGNAAINYFKDQIEDIIVFSRDEKKQYDLKNKLNNNNIKFIIGDIRDNEAINHAMKGVDYVFHAAALKHVPTGEEHPNEIIKTNVIGSNHVFEAAINNHVAKVIALSTDKAVYPINAMGISKALMEKIALSKKSKTEFIVTRYGNVINSRGSVIPHFIDLAKQNLPITITGHKHTRFMMSIDDAIALVDFAFKNGKHGEIFVKKSPSVFVDYVARSIVEVTKSTSALLYQHERAGEKTDEVLINKEEMTYFYDHGEYYRKTFNKKAIRCEEYSSAKDVLSYKDTKLLIENLIHASN